MDTALCLADMAPPIGAKVDGSVRTKRGEHAFTHPEWDRPWRSKSQQRRAEELTAKEVEAETQARKNNVLRRQIQVTQAQLRKEASEKQADIAYLEEEHKLQTLKHEGSFTDFKEEASRREMALKRQLANLQRAKDDESRLASEEKRRLETQITTLSEGHSKELAQQVRNDKLEIDSLAKLLAAKDKELKEAETRHHKEALEALTSKDAASDALVKQLHEADENWRQALDDQQNRSNALRKEDLLRAEGLESKLKEANEKVAEGLRKISTLERKIGTLENDATGWANRLLSQVDTMVNSFTGTAPMVTILPKDKPANPLRERLWYRLQQLWELVNSQHDAERKMRDDKETKEEYQMREKKQEKERWEERRRDMLNLEQEMDDLRQKQERLSKAYEELRRHADDVEQSERYLTHRLHYFVDDVIVSEESRTQPTAPPAPRPGPMYIVFLSAQSTSLVSEKQLVSKHFHQQHHTV